MAEDGTPSEPAEEPTAAAPAPKPSKPVPKTKTRAILRSSRRLRFAVVALVIIGLFAGGIYYERTRNKPKRVDPYAGLTWGSTSTYVRGVSGDLASPQSERPGGVGGGSSTPTDVDGRPTGGLGARPGEAIAAGGVSESTPSTARLGPAPDPCSLLTEFEVRGVAGDAVTSAAENPENDLNGISGIQGCRWATGASDGFELYVQTTPDGSGDLFYERFRLGPASDVADLGDRAYLTTLPAGASTVVVQRGQRAARLVSNGGSDKAIGLSQLVASRL